MDNMKEFKKLVKSLPEDQRARLPEKIRGIVNRQEHTAYIKSIALGAYLSLNDEISLIGYITDLPEDIAPDRQYCTAIRDDTTNTMIIGENAIHSTMSMMDFKKKVLYS